MSVELYMVGGAVRDMLLEERPHDIDFTVVAPSYDAMCEYLLDNDFTIFLAAPEYFTVRARFPGVLKGSGGVAHPAARFAGKHLNTLTADFVLARKESTYSDGRRPDSVEAGTLEDDLSRRDFTVNAIAMAADGTLIDPFGGRDDLRLRRLQCVGSTEDRLQEDALRALRAIRFGITKGFYFSDELVKALHSKWLPPLVTKLAVERKREELHKCFKHNTLLTLNTLDSLPWALSAAIFSNGLWLEPSLKTKGISQ